MINSFDVFFENQPNIIVKGNKKFIKIRKEEVNMENEIMRFEEVMEFLNIGKNTLYKLLNNGEINAFKIGKVWIIPKKSIEEYIRNSLEQM